MLPTVGNYPIVVSYPQKLLITEPCENGQYLQNYTETSMGDSGIARFLLAQ